MTRRHTIIPWDEILQLEDFGRADALAERLHMRRRGRGATVRRLPRGGWTITARWYGPKGSPAEGMDMQQQLIRRR